MIKQKLCKPHGKTSGYKSCGKLTDVARLKFGLCPTCFVDWLMNTEPGEVYMNKAMVIGKKNVDKKAKVEKKELREKLKTLGQYESEAKSAFQLFIRLRDKDLGCISCRGNNKDLWDGGHFFKAELFSGLIFDERNCHKQCRKCNRFLNGNELRYRKGLIRRYGVEFVEQLESESDSKRVYKFTKQELIDIKKEYELKIKQLKL